VSTQAWTNRSSSTLAWDLTEHAAEFPVCRHRLNKDQRERIEVGSIDPSFPVGLSQRRTPRLPKSHILGAARRI
jgi:hypothetical protein